MRILDVITACDKLKPNEYSQSQKRIWANKIESDIRKYASLHSHRKPDMSFSDEENPVLFLDDTMADIYIYYLISMIDLSNQEYNLYNISAAYFNSIYYEWKKSYRRENMPACSTGLKY